jgi:hypothetical protein
MAPTTSVLPYFPSQYPDGHGQLKVAGDDHTPKPASLVEPRFADLLPDVSRALEREILGRRDDRRAVHDAATAAAGEIRMELDRARIALGYAKRGPSGGYGQRELDDDHFAVQPHVQRVRRLEADLALALDKAAAAKRAFVPAAAAAQVIERYGRSIVLTGDVLTEYGSKLAAVWPEDAPRAIEALQQEIAQVQADLLATVACPLPSPEVKSRVHEWVEKLAERGAPALLPVFENGFEPTLPEVKIEIALGGATADGTAVRCQGFTWPPDAVAYMTWLWKDRVLERLDEAIEAGAMDDIAMTPGQKAARLGDLRRQLFDLEIQECSAIAVTGGAVPYRADCDPRAMLRLSFDCPPPDHRP